MYGADKNLFMILMKNNNVSMKILRNKSLRIKN
jgi:hypothetical protein